MLMTSDISCSVGILNPAVVVAVSPLTHSRMTDGLEEVGGAGVVDAGVGISALGTT